MKVYATQKVNGEIICHVWNSKKSFQKYENWCDEKFISVGTASDLKWYEFANEKSMIVHTPDRQISRLIFRMIYRGDCYIEHDGLEIYFEREIVRSNNPAFPIYQYHQI